MSCGACSVRMALEYLGRGLPESLVRRRVRTSRRVGTLPGLLLRGCQELLDESGLGLRVRMVRGARADTGTVVESLRQGLPVICSYLAENHFRPGTLIGHYSVIFGASAGAREFIIANPFGGVDRVPADEFWKMTEFDFKAARMPVPFSMRLGKAARILTPRTLFVFEEKEKMK